MSNDAGTLRGAYREAIARTLVARAMLEGCEPGTPSFGQAAENLSRCMRAEMEAGRSFMAATDAEQSAGAHRRRQGRGARRPEAQDLSRRGIYVHDPGDKL